MASTLCAEIFLAPLPLRHTIMGSDGAIIKIWRGNSWQPSEVIDELRKTPNR